MRSVGFGLTVPHSLLYVPYNLLPQVGVAVAEFRVIQTLIEYSLPRLLGFDELLQGAPKITAPQAPGAGPGYGQPMPGAMGGQGQGMGGMPF